MKDLSPGSEGADTGTETVGVAMLSGSHIFEGLREFYVLRMIVLDWIASDSSTPVADIF